MAATYANSLLLQTGDAFLLESRHEAELESVAAVTVDTAVKLVKDEVRAKGDLTASDELVISDPTDADDGDDFILQGTSAGMAKVAQEGGFVNQAVLPRFSRGLTGGPGFNTVVQEVADGGEVRISKWQRPKRRFDIGAAIDTREDFRALMAHYQQVKGALYGFRMRDPFDWSTHPNHMTKPDPANPLHRQLIGAGDGSNKTFQLVKRYRMGGLSRARPITHPQFRGSENDDGPIPPAVVTGGDPTDFVNEIFVDGVQQTEGTHFVWVWNGGYIEFLTAPAAGTSIYWCGTFEVPVRFDQSIDQGMLASMRTDVAFDLQLTATELSVPEVFSDHKWMGGIHDIFQSQDEWLDPARGRYWRTQPSKAGLKLYAPDVRQMLDGQVIMTVHNISGLYSVDVYAWDQSSSKLFTVGAFEHAHLLLCKDGEIRGMQ